ncbi:MAG TPA: Hsp20/alpha crystallin family protein [Methylococcus sp.]|nr:Hsp20/alpha crystallin family protein [Methylococcus sp.]
MSKKKDESAPVEGILSGLTSLIDKLNELAKTGKELRESGEFGGGKGDQRWRGVFGVRVRTLGGEEPSVEPFGNLHRDREQGYTVTPEVLEPMVDVFEEADHTLVIAEVPGVSLEDVQVDLKDDILTIDAARGNKKYHKELLLPRAYAREKLQLTCNNGILEIKCLNG